MTATAPEIARALADANMACGAWFESTRDRWQCVLAPDHPEDHIAWVMVPGTAHHTDGRADPYATAAVRIMWSQH